MLFSLLEYLQMLKHMENIWEKKMQAYFSQWKKGGGSFSLLTLSVWEGWGGGQGEFSVSFEEIFSSQGCKQL